MQIHNKKLLVIVAMFKHWRHYVKDSYHTVEVLTDHNNLKSFMNIQELNERQVKWVMRLLICNFEIALDWSRWVEYLSSSWVLDSSRLDLSQNSWLKYLSQIKMFNLSIQVESESWNRVSTRNSRLDSSKHEDR